MMDDDIEYKEVIMPSGLNELEKMGAARGKKISAIAEQAIREAAARRIEQDAAQQPAKEYNGRKGLNPTRYRDWENKGIASDF